jgi:hypothetical protein
MATTDIERIHYYQRQYLGAADFEAQQSYLRDMRRRHNIGQHTLGIVVGLELVEQPSQGAGGGVDVFIQPGMAVDGYGREIFVLAPQQLDPVLFDPFLTKQHRKVYIAYSQQTAQQPAAGYEVCEVADQYARIIETFEIVVEPKQPFHGDVIVGGKALQTAPFPPPSPPPANPDLTIPPDESVPYQELPDDQNQPRWLIRLGSVNWDGVNQQFITTTPDHYFEDRVYAGVIADRIFAPAEKLTISPREIPSDADPSDLAKIDMDAADFAEVRGRLRVDGRIVAKKDLEIHGGRLSFLDAGGLDENVPLWIQRQAPPAGAGVDLRVHIGDTPDATTRLSIGPKKGAGEAAVLAVRGDDTVEIETGTLEFGNTPRQMINLASSSNTVHEYGIGVQSGALYLRSDREFYWYKDGSHVPGPNDAGPGGSVQLRLDDFARLHFGAQVRQMLNLWKEEYGIGVQAGTLYFRTASDFCWFRGGTHADGQDDPGGGNRVMMVDSSNKLTLSGDFTNTGDALIGSNNDRTLTVRRIVGKSAFNDSVGDLFLNFQTGKDVMIGNMSGSSSTLRVSGDLRVRGSTNLIHMAQQTFAKSNQNNNDNPRTWHYDYSAENFVEVYAAYAVLQGFSVFNNEDNTAFTGVGHTPGGDFIPQHVYVRITTAPPYPLNGIDGVCFCSESNANAPESDNTVLFTVVVIGKTAA